MSYFEDHEIITYASINSVNYFHCYSEQAGIFQLPTFSINQSDNMMDTQHKDDTEQIKVTCSPLVRTSQLPQIVTNYQHQLATMLEGF